jgi:hypothetical protein
MIQFLLAQAAADNAAKDGSPIGAVFVVLVILLLLIALLAHAFGPRGRRAAAPVGWRIRRPNPHSPDDCGATHGRFWSVPVTALAALQEVSSDGKRV